MSSIPKNVLLSEEHIREFERYFPKTSLSWALDMLLERFISQYKHTPEEYAALAAEQLKEEIGR